MRINNVNPDIYGAKFLSVSISGCELQNIYLLAPSSIVPTRLKNKVRLREITLTVDFEGVDERDATVKLSNFTSILQNAAELELDDGFYYYCILTKIGKQTKKTDWIQQTSYTLVGFRHGPMERIEVSESTDIFVEGNTKTECKYIINTEQSSVTVNGITVSNIEGEIIIDGIDKVVTEDGHNKFVDCDMTEFPNLSPGINHIALTGTATVIIEYYPIYM